MISKLIRVLLTLASLAVVTFAVINREKMTSLLPEDIAFGKEEKVTPEVAPKVELPIIEADTLPQQDSLLLDSLEIIKTE